MRLADRIRRWWSPAEWRDEHPQVSDGETLSEKQQEELHEMQYHDHPGGRRADVPLGQDIALPSELDEEREPDDA